MGVFQSLKGLIKRSGNTVDNAVMTWNGVSADSAQDNHGGLVTISDAGVLTTRGLECGGASIVAAASPYTITARTLLLCNCTDGAITVNLLDATAFEGRLHIIKKTDASLNAVTIDGNGTQTIEGALTQTLALQYSTLIIISYSGVWHKVGLI